MSIGTTILSLFKITFPEWKSAISIPKIKIGPDLVF